MWMFSGDESWTGTNRNCMWITGSQCTPNLHTHNYTGITVPSKPTKFHTQPREKKCTDNHRPMNSSENNQSVIENRAECEVKEVDCSPVLIGL